MARNKEKIARALSREGFNRWTKGGHDRMYYSARDAGDYKRTYTKRGRMNGGVLADGTELSRSAASSFENDANVYYDLNTGELKGSTGMYNNANNEAIKGLINKHLKRALSTGSGRHGRSGRSGG